MKRLKDNCDMSEARHGTLPETYTSSKRNDDEATFYSPTRNEWSTPGCVRDTKPEERQFAVDSGAEYAYGQQEKTLTLPSWRP